MAAMTRDKLNDISKRSLEALKDAEKYEAYKAAKFIQSDVVLLINEYLRLARLLEKEAK